MLLTDLADTSSTPEESDESAPAADPNEPPEWLVAMNPVLDAALIAPIDIGTVGPSLFAEVRHFPELSSSVTLPPQHPQAVHPSSLSGYTAASSHCGPRAWYGRCGSIGSTCTRACP